ncbi:hypothetical protein CCW50_25600, partial [Salmonella enterica subsp. enterica serovar Weltevreden]|nr:hypothetical protein [Salmonella enterica subsp. enterica serovar Weltevreden]
MRHLLLWWLLLRQQYCFAPPVMRWYQMRRREWMPPMLMTRRLLRWPLMYLLTLLRLSQMFLLRLPMRLPPFPTLPPQWLTHLHHRHWKPPAFLTSSRRFRMLRRALLMSAPPSRWRLRQQLNRRRQYGRHLHSLQMFSLRLPMRLLPFWLCQPTPRWLMPPRLLWSPYLRCSPQMLRMRLPVWLMLLPLR